MSDRCPHCNADLVGGQIPDDIAHYYSGKHWRREVGVEVRGVYDGVLFWKCPDCDWAWSRDWSGYGRRAEFAAEYVDAHNERICGGTA